MQSVTGSEKETYALGRRLGQSLVPGDIVLLLGDLGAGKSVFARGIARGLGIEGPIPSPTFTMMQRYTGGRCPLSHFDLYRLDGADAFYELGFEDWMGEDAVAVVEWPERCMEAMPARRLEIRIEHGDTEDARVLTITPCGGFPALKEEHA